MRGFLGGDGFARRCEFAGAAARFTGFFARFFKGLFIGDVRQQHLQVRQQGRHFLRFQHGRLHLELGPPGWHERGVGLDLPLDFFPGQIPCLGGIAGRGELSGKIDGRDGSNRRLRSGFLTHLGPLRPSMAGVWRLSGGTLP
jgi:hypothetical protein